MKDEMIMNEEVIEVVEELAPAKAGIGGKVLAGVGLTVLACGAAYKFVVKPLVAKYKAKKDKQTVITADKLIDDENNHDVEED